MMCRGEVQDGDSESESAEDQPKPYAQEMKELKDEILEGIKKEEYPFVCGYCPLNQQIGSNGF